MCDMSVSLQWIVIRFPTRMALDKVAVLPRIDATSQLRSRFDREGLTVIGATSRLMLLRCWNCNTEKDVLSGLYLHDQLPQSG